MAYFIHEVSVNVDADRAWDALRDVGHLHTRLVKGFVSECQFDGVIRVLKFVNGVVTTERIVSVSEASRRVSWSAVSDRLTHHNASACIVRTGPQSCRVVWSVDLLPDSMASAIEAMVQTGLQAIKRTLEAPDAA